MNVNWINRILSHKETPPPGVWMKIANELDKDEQENSSSLTTKMLAWEVTPPVAALANIFNTLDKEENNAITGYAKRIYNYKVNAPLTVWQNIEGQLNKDGAGKLISFKPQRNKIRTLYVRITAAAAIIAIVITTVLLNIKEKTVNINEPVVSVTPQSQHRETPKVDTEKITLPASDSQEKSNTIKENIAKQAEKKLTIKETTVTDYIKGNDVTALAPNPTETNNKKLQNSKGETPMDIALMNTPNTYISITGPDGQSVKVSSKFSNLIGYLTDKNNDTQENLDIIIKESAKWRATFAKWRDKMTNNTIAPSLGNFMDIIELSKVLEEKK